MNMISPSAVSTVSGVTQTYVTFVVSGVEFAIPTMMVREVYAPVPTVLHVPHAPEQVLGVVNLRSQIFLVLRTSSCLRLEVSNSDHTESRLLLLKQNVADNCGLLVDRVGDIVSLGDDQLRATSEDVVSQAPWQVGVGQLQDRILSLLDPRRLVEHVAQLIRQQPLTGRKPGESSKERV
jgi:purine-binding chemotaxis protein CheW